MITQYLVEKSNGLLNIQSEVTSSDYQMFDDGATEVQTSEFLWGLVRLLKPGFVLETGTYTGVSSMYMGQALCENNKGHLVTVEIAGFHKERAEKLWQQVGLSEWITCQQLSSLEYAPDRMCDLIFLDSEPELRFKELVRFYPYLKEGRYLLIHDLFGHLGQEDIINPDHPDIPHWPFGTLPDEMSQWLKEDKLRVIPLPAPRGLCLFYKPKKDDYKPKKA